MGKSQSCEIDRVEEGVPPYWDISGITPPIWLSTRGTGPSSRIMLFWLSAARAIQSVGQLFHVWIWDNSDCQFCWQGKRGVGNVISDVESVSRERTCLTFCFYQILFSVPESNPLILCIVNLLPIFCDKYIQHSPLNRKQKGSAWYSTVQYSTVQSHNSSGLNAMFNVYPIPASPSPV